ncbi:hypothetical protein, partial [uncultured Shewanella sp.]|uniref:hypothetical protein n=1 Tax=uncultured Shewanella sp. TaxID=173975 RepID=UPI00261632F2
SIRILNSTRGFMNYLSLAKHMATDVEAAKTDKHQDIKFNKGIYELFIISKTHGHRCESRKDGQASGY